MRKPKDRAPLYVVRREVTAPGMVKYVLRTRQRAARQPNKHPSNRRHTHEAYIDTLDKSIFCTCDGYQYNMSEKVTNRGICSAIGFILAYEAELERKRRVRRGA